MPPTDPMHTTCPRVSSRQAFTLIELLTVIAIIGILAAIIFASLGRFRESTQRATCLSNLRQIQAANQLYATEHKGDYVRIKYNKKWWFVQEDFNFYLNGEKRTSGESHSMLDPLKCPSIKYLAEGKTNTWEKENFPGYGYHDFGVSSSNGSYTALNQNNVLKPAQIMAFADALDFHYYKIPPSKYDWENESKIVVTISYRHREGACVVYFDGHAGRLDRNQIEPTSQHKSLWSNAP